MPAENQLTHAMETTLNENVETTESRTAKGIGSSDLLGWAFAQADDEENWTGPCDTREAAIEEAWDYYGDEQSIAVAPCYKPGPDDDDDWDFVVREGRETIEPNTAYQPTPGANQ